MRLLRWYFDTWKQILGGAGSLVGGVLFTGPALLVAVLAILYWGVIQSRFGPFPTVLLAVAIILGTFFAMVLALGRLVDPYSAGVGRGPSGNASERKRRVPRDVRSAIAGMVSDQNREFAMQAAVAMLMGIGLLIVVRWVLLWFFHTMAYILSFTSLDLPYSAPEWATWAALGLLAFAAYRKMDPLAEVDTSLRLDSPAAMGSLGVSNPRVYLAANATLLIEPFRLIFESIWLARSIRPERASDIEAAAKLVPRMPTDRSVRLPTTNDVLRVLLRSRMIKVDPAKPNRFVYLITEKAKDLLVEIRDAEAPAGPQHSTA